jgi:hypothetical protein
MAYGPNFPEMWKRAATYMDRILKGAKAGELPIERPSKFELVINLKTAKALGLDMPWFLQQRADRESRLAEPPAFMLLSPADDPAPIGYAASSTARIACRSH